MTRLTVDVEENDAELAFDAVVWALKENQIAATVIYDEPGEPRRIEVIEP